LLLGICCENIYHHGTCYCTAGAAHVKYGGYW
jgi:hypothetical protein